LSKLPEEDEKWFRANAKNSRDAEIGIAAEEGASNAEIGRRAGFSGGKSRDPEKRKHFYAAAASRALGSRRIQRLREQYRLWKASQNSPVASADETMVRLSEIVRTGSDSAAIQAAARLLDAQRRGGPRKVAPELVPEVLNSACRPDRSLLLRVIALSAGLTWKRGGMSCLKDWEPPEHMAEVTALMERYGCDPAEALAVLSCK
jgi:hypothetical protein